MAVQWGYHFVTGLRNVDRQHESLVALVNRLEEVATGNSLPDEIDAAFRNLKDYAAEHFALEERLMEESGMDGDHIAAHKQAHAAFVAQLSDMWRAKGENPDGTIKQLLEFLTTWIYRHLLITDQEMARNYHRRKGMAVPPSLLLTNHVR